MKSTKKSDTNELTYKTEIDSDMESKLTLTKGERWGWGEREIWNLGYRYTRLYIK